MRLELDHVHDEREVYCSRMSTPARLFLAALLAVAATGACSEKPRVPRLVPTHPRPAIEAPVLVLGIDGFEWSVILPLLAEGRMPALASLMERGIVGKLKPLHPTISPRLWTTIATGKLPDQHGILDFTREPRESDGKRIAYTSFDRKVKAYWNILGDWSLSSDTFGWWMTYPAEEVLGSMVAQTNSTKGVKKGTLVTGMHGQVWPPEEEAAVLATLAETDAELPELERQIFGDFFRSLEGGAKERWKECEWAFRADNTYLRVLERRLDRGPPSDVTSIYFGGTDVVGHRFWAAHDPAAAGLEPDSTEVVTFAHVIPAYYVWVDGAIGRILKRFPADATVLIVSDHGMTLHPKLAGKTLTQEDLDGFTGHHVKREPGVFLAAGAGIARSMASAPPDGWTVASIPVLGNIYDFCPTLLALLCIPTGEDMHGEALTALLDPSLLERCPPSKIPTHDDAAWRKSRDVLLQLEEDPERIEQLQQLGYLGDEDAGD
jgi:predicted AlkP superfamily phosphohydrolase/phosphomutase